MPYRYVRRYKPRRAVGSRRVSARRTYGRRYSAVAGNRRSYPKRYGQRYRTSAKIRAKWEKATPSANQRLIKFVYADNGFSLAPVAGNSYQDYYVFRGNGPYDPDATGVGVQPYGYDNWLSSAGSTAFYNRYRVAASKITVYLATSTATATCPEIRIYLVPSEMTVITPRDPSDITQIVLAKQTKMGTNTNRGSSVKFSHYCTTKMVLGKARAADADSSSVYNNTPTDQWYWHVIVDNSNWAAETSIKFDVKIKYYTILTKAIVQDES